MPMARDLAVDSAVDRRRMPRLAAPVIYRRSGSGVFHHQRSSVDVSGGGMRVLSDEPFRQGDRLELDLLPPGDPPIHIWARVAWVEELPTGADASHEVGLQFTDVADEDRQRLASMLVRKAGGQSSAATVDAELAAPRAALALPSNAKMTRPGATIWLDEPGLQPKGSRRARASSQARDTASRGRTDLQH